MIDTELVYLNALNEVLNSNLTELPKDLKPKNEVEFYLAKIFNNLAGVDSELPPDLKPSTRKEILLSIIEKNSRNISVGDGNSGGSGENEHIKRILKLYIPILDICENTNTTTDEPIITITKVADDVHFGPEYDNAFDNCDHEVFRYNDDVLTMVDGNLVFKNSTNILQQGIKTQTFNDGDVYTLVFDNTNTDAFDNCKLRFDTRFIEDENMLINSDIFEVKPGYPVDNGIKIITEFNYSTDEVTVDEDNGISICVVDLSSLDYNHIKGVKI